MLVLPGKMSYRSFDGIAGRITCQFAGKLRQICPIIGTQNKRTQKKNMRIRIGEEYISIDRSGTLAATAPDLDGYNYDFEDEPSEWYPNGFTLKIKVLNKYYYLSLFRGNRGLKLILFLNLDACVVQTWKIAENDCERLETSAENMPHVIVKSDHKYSLALMPLKECLEKEYSFSKVERMILM